MEQLCVVSAKSPRRPDAQWHRDALRIGLVIWHPELQGLVPIAYCAVSSSGTTFFPRSRTMTQSITTPKGSSTQQLTPSVVRMVNTSDTPATVSA